MKYFVFQEKNVLIEEFLNWIKNEKKVQGLVSLMIDKFMPT